MGRVRIQTRTNPGAVSAIRDFILGLDYAQLTALLFLLGIGLVFIHSTGLQVDTPLSRSFLAKQLQWIAAGTVLWLAAAVIDYRKVQYRVLAVLFYLATVALLVAVLLFGVTVYGATRWLSIFGQRLQPSEFSKLSLTLILAAMFSTPFFNINRFRWLAAATALAAVPFLLIVKEPDLGSAIILLPIFLSILFCAGLRWRWIIIAVSIFVLIGGLAVLNEVMEFKPLLHGYQRRRIEVFFNPELDRMGAGYNAHQARLAVGSGGIDGKGIGRGTQNTLGFLPQTVSNNDFIFSVIAEETGFLGCLALLAGYLLLLWSTMRTAWLTRDRFGRYIAVGVAAMLFSHLYINIGMSIGLTPVTGLSLPFISYGGSFVMNGMLALGILQSVYRYAREED